MSRRPAEVVVELLKLLRERPRTLLEIDDWMGWHPNTSRKWMAEFELNGLVTTTRQRRETGAPPKVYALAPCWIGPAAIPSDSGAQAPMQGECMR